MYWAANCFLGFNEHLNLFFSCAQCSYSCHCDLCQFPGLHDNPWGFPNPCCTPTNDTGSGEWEGE